MRTIILSAVLFGLLIAVSGPLVVVCFLLTSRPYIDNPLWLLQVVACGGIPALILLRPLPPWRNVAMIAWTIGWTVVVSGLIHWWVNTPFSYPIL